MAPQIDIPPAANVLGTIGTVAGVFRIWKNHRRKSTEGCPGLMLFLWAVCTPPLGAYAVVQNFNLPLQIQPSIFCALCLFCWAQTLVYKSGYSVWKTVAITLATATSFAGLEVVLVKVLQGPYSRGIEWPVTFLGIFSAVLLAVGLLPPYWEMYKRNGRVYGLSFRYIAIDFAGAFFSLIALAVQHTFDLVGGTSYIGVIVMEIGIVSSHLIWLYRTRHDHRAARAIGMSYDDYIKSLELPNSKLKPGVSNSSSVASLNLDKESFHEDPELGQSFKSCSSTKSYGEPWWDIGNMREIGMGQHKIFGNPPNTPTAPNYAGYEQDVEMAIPPPAHIRTADRAENLGSRFQEML